MDVCRGRFVGVIVAFPLGTLVGGFLEHTRAEQQERRKIAQIGKEIQDIRRGAAGAPSLDGHGDAGQHLP